MTFDAALQSATKEASRYLRELGLNCPFTVKPYAYRDTRLGGYVRFSQFRSRGAVFRISTKLPSLCEQYGVAAWQLEEVIFDTILHEYGHLIYEFVKVRIPSLLASLGDEEEFAENWFKEVE